MREATTEPVTPLVLEIPMRGGKFTAQIRMPLDASASEIAAIDAAFKSTYTRPDSPPRSFIKGMSR